MSRVRSAVGRARRAAKRRLRELTTERQVPIADLSAPIVPTETASPVVTPFETYFTSEHTTRLREEWRDAEPPSPNRPTSRPMSAVRIPHALC